MKKIVKLSPSETTVAKAMIQLHNTTVRLRQFVDAFEHLAKALGCKPMPPSKKKK